MKMEYSVVIPAYNAARTIAESIQSILNQSVKALEIVVVDDGSTDDTHHIARSQDACVTVITQSNQGPGAAMTRAMHRVHTPVIASLDADDVWLPNKMQHQLAFLEQHPTCAGCFGQLQHFGESVHSEIVTDGWTRTTMTIRREVFESVGEVIDPPGRRGELIDWIAKARESGFELTMIPKILAKRRVAAGTLSHQRNDQDRGYVHVARAALLRKRAREQASVRS
tara:strand:+ start:110 stop:784 length:675 start_codon:yes stop_codon:yes gene_type:complete